MTGLQNLSACLVSKHNKIEYIETALKRAFAWQLNGSNRFDTDMLGTFSGESERTLSPIDCAIYKANKALKLSGNDIGLGSEGSFNPDGYGVMTVNQELLACVHREKGLLAVGQAIRPVHVRTWTIELSDAAKVEEIIEALPDNQALIMRTVDVADENTAVQYGETFKGLLSEEQIHTAYAALCGAKSSLKIEICYDLRAMFCPERQVTIGLAAKNLVERLLSVCPHCNTIDFYAEIRLSGLPCETCGLPTTMTKAFKAKCNECEFESVNPVEQQFAETVNCSFCNP